MEHDALCGPLHATATQALSYLVGSSLLLALM